MRAGTNSADTLPRSKRVCFRSKLIVSDEEVEDSSEDSQHEDDTNESDFEQEGDTQQQEPDGKTVAGGHAPLTTCQASLKQTKKTAKTTISKTRKAKETNRRKMKGMRRRQTRILA